MTRRPIIGRLFHGKSARPTAKRRESNQEQKTPIPPTIKNVRNDNDKQVLYPQIPVEHKPVKQKNNRQKQSKRQRIKKHS
jgi:hypothetical protein